MHQSGFMKRHSFQQVSVFVLLLLALGCNIGARTPRDTTDASAAQQLPFADGKVLVVPANSAIYVRLQQTISSATARAGQDFAALLDEPLLVDGKTVAPQGTLVTGKVVAASEPGHRHGASYLRITLSSLVLNGKTMPLQTNSVFVGGRSYKNRNIALTSGGTDGAFFGAVGKSTAAFATEKKEVGFVADRRLGFRLTQPVNAP